MPKRRVKERRRQAQEFKRLVQIHGGRRSGTATPTDDRPRQPHGPRRAVNWAPEEEVCKS